MTEHRVRAYVGLGANLGDAGATLASAVRSLAGLPGAKLRGVSRLYATDPVGVTDQPEFRNAVVALDVPAGPDPATGALQLLASLKGLERAFGRRRRRRTGGRASSISTSSCSVEPGSRSNVRRRPVRSTRNPIRSVGHGCWSCPIPRPPSGCSCSRRWPTLRPAWCRRAGTSRWATARRRREIAEGPDAVRPIAHWDRAAGAWRPLAAVATTG